MQIGRQAESLRRTPHVPIGITIDGSGLLSDCCLTHLILAC